MQLSGIITIDRSDVHAKGQDHTSAIKVTEVKTSFAILSQFKASTALEEMRFWFSRSSVNFQGLRRQKFVDFYIDLAFPDCNSSLKSSMATK